MSPTTSNHQIKWDRLVAELVSAMNNPQSSHVLDRVTLEITTVTDEIPESMSWSDVDMVDFEMSDEWEDDSIVAETETTSQMDRYIPIKRDKTANLLKIVAAFIDVQKDSGRKAALKKAMDHAKPWPAFQKELTFHAGLKTQWRTFKENAYKEKARQWLITHGILNPAELL